METKINQAITSVLERFGEKYFIDDALNKSKVIQDLDNYDATLLKAFISNEILKNNFTIDIDGNIILQTNKLIELFEADEYWKDSYTKYTKKIGLTAGGKFIDESSDVVLNFPYKDTVLKASMSKEDTDKDDLRPEEPFLNEVIAKEEVDVLLDKKILVNAKKYNENSVHEVDRFSEEDNLIMKGNNLLALHTLKEKYAGKVKLIYIDPPYNTGRDSFKYNDNFNRATWLTFMFNRLEIAREFLSDNGSIFVSIDEKQQAYLQVLMNEIFGENNLLEVFHIQARYTQKSLNEKDNFQPVMEYILAYAKDKLHFMPNKPYEDYDLSKFKWDIEELSQGEAIELGGKKVTIFKKGEYKITKRNNPGIKGLKDTWASGSVLTGNTSGKFFDLYLSKRKEVDGLEILYKVEGIGEDGLGYRYFTGPKKESSIRGQFYSGVPLAMQEKIKIGEAKKFKPIVNYYDFSGDFGNIRHEGGVAFNSGKKPEKLLKLIIEIATNELDLVMDFHLGSGSTAATAMKLNRRFIGIEQMDYIKELSVKRLTNVIKGDETGISKDVNWQGGGSFVYVELMEKNRGFLKSIQDAETQTDVQKLFDFMLEEAEIDFRVDLEKVKNTLHELSLDEQKKTLIKIIDKNQLYYNYSEIDDANVRDLITDNDYAFNKSFYEESGE